MSITAISPRPAWATCSSSTAYLTREALDRALEAQRAERGSKLLGEILVEQGFCTEDQVVECLADEYGCRTPSSKPGCYDPKIVDLLPREFVEANLVLPLFCVRDVLTVAVAEPSNLFLIEELRGSRKNKFKSSPPRRATSGG